MDKEVMKNIFQVPSTEPNKVKETNNTTELKPKKERLKALTIRVTPSMYDAITSVSEQKSVSKSIVCRLMFTDRLAEYLGTQNYIDKDDSKELIKILNDLLTTVGQIKLELNRIGINYNQEVRLMHIREKNGDNGIKMMQEEKELLTEVNMVNIEDIRKLIDEQDKVITKAGEMACTLVYHPQKMEKHQSNTL